MRISRIGKIVEQWVGRVQWVDLSGVELTPEHFTDPLELMAVPVEASGAYELYIEVLGEPAPDAVTQPICRLHGGVSLSNAFDMAPDDAGLLTNGTDVGDPWGLGDYRRGLVIEDGVLHVSAWAIDSANPGVAPSNSLVIDQGILIIRDMRGI